MYIHIICVYIYIFRETEGESILYICLCKITSIRAFVKSRSGCPQPTGGYPCEGQHQQGLAGDFRAEHMRKSHEIEMLIV